MSLEELQTQAASAEVYYFLAQKTVGEAFDMIEGVEKQNKAEAWRLTVARFDAETTDKEIPREAIAELRVADVEGPSIAAGLVRAVQERSKGTRLRCKTHTERNFYGNP